MIIGKGMADKLRTINDFSDGFDSSYGQSTGISLVSHAQWLDEAHDPQDETAGAVKSSGCHLMLKIRCTCNWLKLLDSNWICTNRIPANGSHHITSMVNGGNGVASPVGPTRVD